MGRIARFLSGYLGEDDGAPGLFEKLDRTVWYRTPGGAENEISSGGSRPVVGCVVCFASEFDIHAAADYPFAWSTLRDNTWDYNPIDAIPTGLGLTFAFDGSDATITTEEAGTWSFFLEMPFLSGADAQIRGRISLPFWGESQEFGPAGVASSGTVSAGGVYQLPAGASSSAVVGVLVDAAANPYNVLPIMSIVRLG